MQCRAIDLGLVNYEDAYNFQRKTREEIKLKAASDVIIFCEHPLIITLGRLAKKENILTEVEYLKNKGIDIYHTDRGGDVTLHSPGQLIIYPIFDLKRHFKDIHLFLKKLEMVMINSLRYYGVSATTKDEFRGVWVEKDKIVSIGIGVKNWITYHGMSVNINNDLHNFSYIRPCGLKIKMISLAKILGKDINIKKIKQIILKNFGLIFNIDIYFSNIQFKTGQLGGDLL
jgi:lipoate-protein ligase B